MSTIAATTTNNDMVVPKLVFIVPYRDREQQLHFFRKQMKEVLEDMDSQDYVIYYIHQCDQRGFNRGALKNIGFLFVKEKYPHDYKNITLVFNDIDTMPFHKNFLHFQTEPGRIKHFYGYQHALGGIVSICAGDFEAIRGFPNFWSWGYEDNLLQQRVLAAIPKLIIDRNQFFPILDKNIMHFGDGLEKEVNRKEYDRYLVGTREGIHSLTDVVYDYDSETQFINVRNFHTGIIHDKKFESLHDIRKGGKPFGNVGSVQPRIFRGASMPLLFGK